ncbi:MAG: hypothetical protein ABSF69_29545 [Polyangiaceae bacterium]
MACVAATSAGAVACILALQCGTDQASSADDGVVDGGAPDSTVADTGPGASVNRIDAAPDSAAPDSAALVSNDDASLEGAEAATLDVAPLSPEVDAGDSVLRHHKNINRDGLYIQPALTKAAVMGTVGSGEGSSPDGGPLGLHEDPAFNAIFPDPNDHVYAQPLFVDGLGGQDMVIVATEANNVYSLDAETGAQLWLQHAGTPVSRAVGCGNIDPMGVTGTPVIDFPSRTLFFDADVVPSGPDGGDAGGPSAHQIFALSIDNGDIKPGRPVNVPAVAISGDGGTAFNSPYQGQRGALAILGGTLYVPCGGLNGECGSYHGWLVGFRSRTPPQCTCGRRRRLAADRELQVESRRTERAFTS